MPGQYGYACLYSYLEKVPITDITLTFVESHHPRELIAHLREVRGYAVEMASPGIYTVTGDPTDPAIKKSNGKQMIFRASHCFAMTCGAICWRWSDMPDCRVSMPIQIVNSRELPDEGDGNLWLKSLSDRLDAAAVNRVMGEMRRQGLEADLDLARELSAFLYAIGHANTEALEEARTMGRSKLTLEQVFENAGWIAKREARGEAKGEARGKEQNSLEIARNMVHMGFPLDTVAAATRVDPEKLAPLYQQDRG